MSSPNHPHRRSIRFAAAAAVTGAAIVLTASAASAHVSFDKTSVPASSEQAIQARVPVEDLNDPTTANDGVRVRLPAAFEALGCDTPIGWTCEVQDRPDGDHVVWTRVSGTGPIDLLDFTVRTPSQVGSYAIPVDQSKTNGDLVSWENAEGEDRPAPVLEVTPAGTAAQENPDEAQPHNDDPAPPAGASASPTTTAPTRQSADTPARPAAADTTRDPVVLPATAATGAIDDRGAEEAPIIGVAVSGADDDTVPFDEPPTLLAAPVARESGSSTPFAAFAILFGGLATVAGTVAWRRRPRTPAETDLV